jgi:hypothetical protein
MENVSQIVSNLVSNKDPSVAIRNDAQKCISCCQKELELLKENFVELSKLLENPYTSSDVISQNISSVSLRTQELAKLVVQTGSVLLLMVDNPDAKRLLSASNINRN